MFKPDTIGQLIEELQKYPPSMLVFADFFGLSNPWIRTIFVHKDPDAVRGCPYFRCSGRSDCHFCRNGIEKIQVIGI